MTARDVINEIAQVRSRRLTDSTTGDLSIRLLALERTFEQVQKAPNESIRYFPVALVACIEGLFRAVIRELIDAGDPYTRRAEKIASKLKLDYSLLAALQGKQLTVGEFVAHGVPISKLEDVNKAMSDLLDTDFLAALHAVTDRWRSEVANDPQGPILANPGQVFDDVKRTFELRHIICHELATGFTFPAGEFSRWFESCVLFLRASEELVFQTVDPNAPLTQADLNAASAAKLGELEEEMAQMLARLDAKLDETHRRRLHDSQEAWLQFQQAWIRLVIGERAEGGSIWPLAYASTTGEMVEQRIVQLEEYDALPEL